MSFYGATNATEHAQNMSRVHLGQQDLLCLTNSTETNSTCTAPAGLGISLSTPILMMTIGVVGNILALLVLYSSRREAQARRTVFFVMLSGLAWTDLIGQLAVSPIAIVTYANNLKWVGGTPLCRYHGYMMVSFGLVIPLIVSCMSCERFIAIRFSYFYARHITRKKAQLTFLACWTVTSIFTILPFAGFGSYERQYPGSWCFLNFHRESVLDSVYAVMFGALNIVAIGVMIVCNVIVALTLFRMRLSRHLNSSPSLDRKLSLSGVIGSSTTPGTVIRGRRHSDMEAQMIWFLCLITIAFTVCWMPLNIHIILTQFTGTTNHALDLIVIRMASCNQILDPWLYVIFRKNSMLRIFKSLKACFGKKKEPPRNCTQRGPSVRYIIGNRSFTIEATTMGKTLMPGRGFNQSPMYKTNGHITNEPSELSADSAESLSRLMYISSNHDDRRSRRRSDQKPLINLRLGHSPSDKRKLETSLSDAQLKSIADEQRKSTLSSNISITSDKFVSLPLIDRTKDKVIANGKLATESSDFKDTFHGSYDSVGSTHYFPSFMMMKSIVKPGTPTNDLFEVSSSSLVDSRSHDSSHQPPKSLIITDSNYVFISPPLASPERLRTPSSPPPGVHIHQVASQDTELSHHADLSVIGSQENFGQSKHWKWSKSCGDETEYLGGQPSQPWTSYNSKELQFPDISVKLKNSSTDKIILSENMNDNFLSKKSHSNDKEIMNGTIPVTNSEGPQKRNGYLNSRTDHISLDNIHNPEQTVFHSPERTNPVCFESVHLQCTTDHSTSKYTHH